MTSHSKSVGGRSVFSYHERELMKVGTRQMIVGKDSIKNFDDCTICLNPAVSPVCCSKGHIFCKECAYQNILHQKKELKARQAEQERIESKRLQKQRTEDAIKRETLADTLTKIDFGILENPPTSAPSGSASAKAAVRLPGDKERGTGSCFWIPSQCPTADNPEGEGDEAKKRKKGGKGATAGGEALGPVCPAAEGEKTHPFRLKNLVTIQFTEATDQKELDEEEERRRGKAGGPKKPRYQCPMCLKTLTNSTQCALPKGCGHVMCRGCVDLLIKAADQEGKGIAPKCYICQHPFTKNHVINLQVGGTGFSGHGDNLTVKSYAPAPRV